MIEERATVEKVADSEIWVRAINPGNCPKCDAGEGCGGGILAKLVKTQRGALRVRSQISALNVGETVIIGLDEAALVSASITVYLVPLLFMFAFGAFAQLALQTADLLVAAFSFCGLALGFWFVAARSRREGTVERYQPVILRRDTQSSETCPRLG